jgi:hypothetical protein
MMMGELKRYSQRQLRNAVLLIRSQEFIPTIMLSKLTKLANKQSIVKVDQDSGAIQIEEALAAIKLEMTNLARALTSVTSFLPHGIKERGPSPPFHLPAYHLPRDPSPSTMRSHASKPCTHGKEEQLEDALCHSAADLAGFKCDVASCSLLFLPLSLSPHPLQRARENLIARSKNSTRGKNSIR